jgi:hypothetical protein
MPVGRSIALLTFATFLTACAESSTSPETPAGDCLTIELGAWNSELPEELPPLPERVALLDSLGSHILENGRTIVRQVPGYQLTNWAFAWWQTPSNDSLRVVFSTGFTGTTLKLRRSGATWLGEAEAFFDFTAEVHTATAEMAPAACE